MELRWPPHIDVVIPVRNRARFIGQCLDSVRAQTLQPSTVVVVDDGSTDDTPGILAEYGRYWPRLHVLRSEPRGASRARNLGLATCRAPLVAFLDSDDIWLPEKLERQAMLFTSGQPELGFVHCGCFQIDEFGRMPTGGRTHIPSKRGDVFGDLLEGFYHVCGSASAVVARRDLVARLGGFDEMLFYGEDADLWIRLAHLSQMDYVPEPLVGLRVHQGNSHLRELPRKEEVFLFQRLRIWNKWYDRIENLNAVLDCFRLEVWSDTETEAIRARPNFGLYGRLKRSELELARQLFPDLLSYVRYALIVTFRRIKSRPKLRPILDCIKSIVARHLILRSNLLLRLMQKMGKFQMTSE